MTVLRHMMMNLLGSSTHEQCPDVIPPSQVQIVHASAGGSHSLFLSQEGRVYACGASGQGQLGLSTDAKIPMPTDVFIPTVSTICSNGGQDVFQR